jgi:nucleoside-diphosphate-sugar epimerase
MTVRHLLDIGYRVTVFDKLLYGDASLADLRGHPAVRVVEGDTRRIDDLMGALWQADAVVHLAELVGDPLCARDPQKTFEINCLASASVARACAALQIKRFIYISSCSVYGSSLDPDAVLDERSPLSPVSLYARLKIAAEHHVLDAASDALSPIIFRLGTVFGMSRRPRFDLVVNTFTAQAVQDGVLRVFGGDQWRPHVHVTDVARAIAAGLAAPLDRVACESFNIVGENTTVDELADMVAEVVGNCRVTHVPQDVDKRNYRVSGAKAEQLLGFRPRVSVREGIAEIAGVLRSGEIPSYTDLRYSNLSAFSGVFGSAA